MGNEELIALAKKAAVAHGLDPALVCAVCEQESTWNPWAIRYEPAFLTKYVLPLPNLRPTEAYSRAISWGLMQLMGQVARERGFANAYLASLCDPATGLDWGCNYLKARLVKARDDVHLALQHWNGGANPNYADEVLARMPRYVAPSEPPLESLPTPAVPGTSTP